MNFSLEIGPHTDLETLPSVKDVYVTMLPGGDYKETADKSGDLVKKGFNPVPHFPARSINNEEELKNYVSRCKDQGVKQALVIGGSREPVGKFDSSYQILETGFFEGIKIGIAGHPSGWPAIPILIPSKNPVSRIWKELSNFPIGSLLPPITRICLTPWSLHRET